ncbi:hypothetical protein BD408DRAFT_48942 [Parasitella parasitica]|nr:hypothetical protein BD408DRAFT_48942 [Parasitella parasitica]
MTHQPINLMQNWSICNQNIQNIYLTLLYLVIYTLQCLISHLNSVKIYEKRWQDITDLTDMIYFHIMDCIICFRSCYKVS